MTPPVIKSQIEIIRRAAERGLKLALKEAPIMVDICQHLLDEAQRTEKYMEKYK